jgi:hypothetical protein
MKKAAVLLFLICSNCFAQVLSNSDLPIITIDTKGKLITDDPKIPVEMVVYWNGKGKTNSVADKPHFKGTAGIEFRGSSSQIWPKKPYGIELWNDKNQPVKFGLFGMPAESDWVLFASYNERSLMHNVLAQKIAGQMGLGNSRTQYCELVIDNDYRGVYVFMEKIKQGKGRVDIADMSEKDLSGDALTGGYIVKVDKTTGTGQGGWQSNYLNYGNNAKTYFQYEYPKGIVSEQRRYIRGVVEKFEAALLSADFVDPVKGYAQYVDLPSFAKFLLVNEISRNVDGYRISSYFFKDKDSKGGKLTAGPAWDFDLTFGNADYCAGDRSTGWAYEFNFVCPDDGGGVPFWWQRMLGDPAFVKVLDAEYKKLRNGYLSVQNTEKVIDSMQTELVNAQVRNFQRWPRLGQYDWPIPRPIASSWNGEVVQLRNWLAARLQWLDANLPKPLVVVDGTLSTEEPIVRATEVYPNPIIDKFLVKLQTPKPEKVTLELIDLSGTMVGTIETETQAGENVVEVPATIVSTMNNVTILRVKYQDKVEIKRLVKM